MKRALFQVAIGEPRPLWERCIASMAVYAQRHGITHIVSREPKLRIVPQKSARSASALKLGYLPNLEKLQGLHLLTQFDQVAIIDSDVYARPTATNIFEAVPVECDLAGVPERSMPINDAYARKLTAYEKAQYGPLDGVGLPFLQFGVIVYNASFRRFCPYGVRPLLELPDMQRFINGEGAWRWQSEQTTMNWFLRSQGAKVQHLPYVWNGLFGMLKEGAMDLAHFVHFLLSDHVQGDDPEELLRRGNAARPRI